ncbi:hypothetical protein BGZ96_009702 [Linnemannia gamsii]|uniref:SCP domain-containing protein n=1 Tax=Linnemannia gamsii TaxID=64522 RepID=A0ABQ7KI85_9FUNG|nr:hypothetical protein BGZ96_009702 [Linnemannia gamsii]
MAEPVGFINTGKGRLLPFTSSEFEAIERGEWPQSLPGYEMPETTDEKFKASRANPLYWNWEAANFGENWLQYCAFQHSHGKFGENLAAGYSDFPAAIKVWYDEVYKYNFNAPGFYSGTASSLPLKTNFGHFTQVVWKSTTSVGCAKRACPNWTIYICNYDPPGNMVSWDNGYFRDNVSPRL